MTEEQELERIEKIKARLEQGISDIERKMLQSLLNMLESVGKEH